MHDLCVLMIATCNTLTHKKLLAMKKFDVILFLFLITFSTNNLIAQEKQNIETFTPGQIALNQGEEYLQKGGEDNLKLALQSFKKAISEDAKLTPAYLGLVNTYRSLGPNYNLISPEETNKQAIEAVNKAMELDPHSVDVILSIAEVKFYFEWDWAEAEKHYIKAISLEPGTSKTVIPYVYFLHFQDRNRPRWIWRTDLLIYRQVRRVIGLDRSPSRGR